MARPQIEIDEELVKKLATIQCTVSEIASMCGCSKDTLERRFAATIKEGREKGLTSLKRKLFETALNGNVATMIFLAKTQLGWHERVVHVNNDESEKPKQEVISQETAKLILEELRGKSS